MVSELVEGREAVEEELVVKIVVCVLVAPVVGVVFIKEKSTSSCERAENRWSQSLCQSEGVAA